MSSSDVGNTWSSSGWRPVLAALVTRGSLHTNPLVGSSVVEGQAWTSLGGAGLICKRCLPPQLALYLQLAFSDNLNREGASELDLTVLAATLDW